MLMPFEVPGNGLSNLAESFLPQARLEVQDRLKFSILAEWLQWWKTKTMATQPSKLTDAIKSYEGVAT